MSESVRLVIADDSAAMRSLIAKLLEREPGIEVVGEADDGESAIERAIELRPDVITMDVAMPRLDGISAVAAIMERAPTRILVVCEASPAARAELSFRAIAAGALELIPKLSGGSGEALKAWGRELADAVRTMSQVPVISRRRRQDDRVWIQPRDGRVDVIGIVASTGGPPALACLLSALGDDVGAAILIAQHTGFGFTPGLASWLGHVARRPIVIAADGQRLQAGHAYLPPDGHHLEVGEDRRIMLVRETAERAVVCPSGTRLLSSLVAHRARAAGVVLTGMGDDGAAGLLALRNAGGFTLAQEPSTCVVGGMPRAAIGNGGARFVLPVDAIALVLRGICSRSPH